MINRRYEPWWRWEDYEAGQYRVPFDLPAEIVKARELLADPIRLLSAMQAVTDAWPASTGHNLTNLEQNRRAWLGQAACCLVAHVSGIATRAAWWQLDEQQRIAANAVADVVISEWERNTEGAETLFAL